MINKNSFYYGNEAKYDDLVNNDPATPTAYNNAKFLRPFHKPKCILHNEPNNQHIESSFKRVFLGVGLGGWSWGVVLGFSLLLGCSAI